MLDFALQRRSDRFIKNAMHALPAVNRAHRTRAKSTKCRLPSRATVSIEKSAISAKGTRTMYRDISKVTVFKSMIFIQNALDRLNLHIFEIDANSSIFFCATVLLSAVAANICVESVIWILCFWSDRAEHTESPSIPRRLGMLFVAVADQIL